MQDAVLDQTYQFIPPHRGNAWPNLIQFLQLYRPYLRRNEGVVKFHVRHSERLTASIRAGYGVLITPNHPRLGDPLVLGQLSRLLPSHLFVMASWHLFKQSWLTEFCVRRMGGFSINRDIVDRQSVHESIRILESAQRPLVIFPEGIATRTNDFIQPLLDGAAVIARAAAIRRHQNNAGPVVVHPVAIKYQLLNNLQQTLDPVLTRIETRLTWQPTPHRPLLNRIHRIGRALLALKESEIIGRIQHGPLRKRLHSLINLILHPIEVACLGHPQTGPEVTRIKNLRMLLLPKLMHQQLTPEEKHARMRMLNHLELASQLSCYPPNYLREPTPERLLETVERFEEGLNGRPASAPCGTNSGHRDRPHAQFRVLICVGEAIHIEPRRIPPGQSDPTIPHISAALQQMIHQLSSEIRNQDS